MPCSNQIESGECGAGLWERFIHAALPRPMRADCFAVCTDLLASALRARDHDPDDCDASSNTSVAPSLSVQHMPDMFCVSR
jgi:hypothetical protein